VSSSLENPGVSERLPTEWTTEWTTVQARARAASATLMEGCKARILLANRVRPPGMGALSEMASGCPPTAT
jgi:hypothetical protein